MILAVVARSVNSNVNLCPGIWWRRGGETVLRHGGCLGFPATRPATSSLQYTCDCKCRMVNTRMLCTIYSSTLTRHTCPAVWEQSDVPEPLQQSEIENSTLLIKKKFTIFLRILKGHRIKKNTFSCEEL